MPAAFPTDFVLKPWTELQPGDGFVLPSDHPGFLISPFGHILTGLVKLDNNRALAAPIFSAACGNNLGRAARFIADLGNIPAHSRDWVLFLIPSWAIPPAEVLVHRSQAK